MPVSASFTQMAEPRPPAPPVTTATGRASDILNAVTAHAQVGLLLVPGEVFESAETRTVLADQDRGFVGEHALIGAGLDEFPDPEAAGVARGFHGGQRVVRADHF